jgi:hypothetical protein
MAELEKKRMQIRGLREGAVYRTLVKNTSSQCGALRYYMERFFDLHFFREIELFWGKFFSPKTHVLSGRLVALEE